MKKNTLNHRIETKRKQHKMRHNRKVMSQFDKEKKKVCSQYKNRLETIEKQEKFNFEKSLRIHKETKEDELFYMKKVLIWHIF